MKKVLTYFFVALGVIFFVLLIIAAYFVIADPLNLKPLLFSGGAGEESGEETFVEAPSDTEDKHPLLSPSQEEALETFGVDPSAVPSTITPEQEACFEEKLGKERVAEIKAGDSPTTAEFFTARDCI